PASPSSPVLFFSRVPARLRAFRSFPTRRSSDLGERAQRRSSEPVPGDEVLRSVLAEIEDHHRVALRTVGRAHVRGPEVPEVAHIDRKSTRLNSSHVKISYAVFCVKNTMWSGCRK